MYNNTLNSVFQSLEMTLYLFRLTGTLVVRTNSNTRTTKHSELQTLLQYFSTILSCIVLT